MIVRQFVHWLRTAPTGHRADATAALARAYLYSDLSPDDRAAAEGGLLILLDDPSTLVRRTLAEVFAASDAAPAAVVHALSCDQADIAAPILTRSPLLVDADLVDRVATGNAAIQIAIAKRAPLPRSVAAAIAEVGTASACLAMIENREADIAPFSFDRMVERHGHLATVREALGERTDLPASSRQAMVAKLSETLADFVSARAWIEESRARRIAQEACERATVTLAADSADHEVRPLIRHLCKSGQLTAGLILRALLCGNVRLFEEALAELSGMRLSRVSAMVHDRGASLPALYRRARLPESIYPAFREALDAMHATGFIGDGGGASRLKRRMVERVLTRCADQPLDDAAPLLTLLRRFATEAAREEARLFCDGLTADTPAALPEQQIAA